MYSGANETFLYNLESQAEVQTGREVKVCGGQSLCLQRTAGLIQTGEAALDAMTGEEKKSWRILWKRRSGWKYTGRWGGVVVVGRATAALEQENKFYFFLFCARAAAEDLEERRRGTGAGKISEGRVCVCVYDTGEVVGRSGRGKER